MRSGGRASRASPAPRKHAQHFPNTHIHSQTELSDIGPDGRPPTRPASRRRGSGGADGRRTKIRYQHTRCLADTRTRPTFDTGKKAGRPHGARTPTHTHPPTPMLSPELPRVADRATAGRARQRAAGCREGADAAGLPVLEVGQSPCGRSRSSRSRLQLLHGVRLLLWRADRREASDARHARSRGRVAQRTVGTLREGSVRACMRGAGSAGASFSSSGVSCCGAQS